MPTLTCATDDAGTATISSSMKANMMQRTQKVRIVLLLVPHRVYGFRCNGLNTLVPEKLSGWGKYFPRRFTEQGESKIVLPTFDSGDNALG